MRMIIGQAAFKIIHGSPIDLYEQVFVNAVGTHGREGQIESAKRVTSIPTTPKLILI